MTVSRNDVSHNDVSHKALTLIKVLLYVWALCEWAAAVGYAALSVTTIVFLTYLDNQGLTILDAPAFINADSYSDYLSVMTMLEPLLTGETRVLVTSQLALCAVESILFGYIWYSLGRLVAAYLQDQLILAKTVTRLQRFLRIVGIAFVVGIAKEVNWSQLLGPIKSVMDIFIARSPELSGDAVNKILGALLAPNFMQYALPVLNGASLILLFLCGLIGLKLVRDNRLLAADRDQLKQEVELTV